MLGGPAQSYVPFRNAGQWVVGVALGLYFTPQVVRLVLGLWWEIALGVVWAVALGWFFGLYLQRVHAGPGRWHIPGLTRTTTYFASPIGAASEMTLMAERRGAQTELVASAHSLRVLMVTLVIPFGLQWSGLQGLDISLPGTRETSWPGLCLLALLLGTAPGGIAEMSITAKMLQLGVPVVTAFQVTRLAAVLVLTEPLYRWRYGPQSNSA